MDVRDKEWPVIRKKLDVTHVLRSLRLFEILPESFLPQECYNILIPFPRPSQGGNSNDTVRIHPSSRSLDPVPDRCHAATHNHPRPFGLQRPNQRTGNHPEHSRADRNTLFQPRPRIRVSLMSLTSRTLIQ